MESHPPSIESSNSENPLQETNSLTTTKVPQYENVGVANLRKNLVFTFPFDDSKLISVVVDNFYKDLLKVHFINSKDMSLFKGTFFHPASFKIGCCKSYNHCSYSIKSNFLAVADDQSKKISIFNCLTKKKICVKKLDKEYIDCVNISPTGKLVAVTQSGSERKTTFYSIPEFEKKGSCTLEEFHAATEAMIFSLDEKWCFCGNTLGQIIKINIDTFQVDSIFQLFNGPSPSINTLSWSSDGKTLVSISSQLGIKGFDPEGMKITHRLYNFEKDILDALLIKDNQLLVCVGQSIKLYDWKAARIEVTLPRIGNSLQIRKNNFMVPSRHISVDGKFIFCSYDDGQVIKVCESVSQKNEQKDVSTLNEPLVDTLADIQADTPQDPIKEKILVFSAKKQFSSFPFFIASHNPDELLVCQSQYGINPSICATILNSNTFETIRTFPLVKINLENDKIFYNNHTLVVLDVLNVQFTVYDTLTGKVCASQSYRDDENIGKPQSCCLSSDAKLFALVDFSSVHIFVTSSFDVLYSWKLGGPIAVNAVEFSSIENQIIVFVDSKPRIFNYETQKDLLVETELDYESNATQVVNDTLYVCSIHGMLDSFDFKSNKIIKSFKLDQRYAKNILVISNDLILINNFRYTNISDFNSSLQEFSISDSRILACCLHQNQVFTVNCDDSINKYSISTKNLSSLKAPISTTTAATKSPYIALT